MSKVYHNNVMSGVQYGLVRPSTSSSSSASDNERRGCSQFVKENKLILVISLVLVVGVIGVLCYAGYLLAKVPTPDEYQGKV